MPSIRSFLLRDDREERPARFIEAILADSSLIAVVRDGAGRFVEGSAQALRAADASPEEAGDVAERLRYFDEDGRELSRLDAPAQAVRLTGRAQRDGILGMRFSDGREIWLKGDTLPLERGPQGWAVLGLATDVTDLYRGRAEARERAAALEALLDLAGRFAHARFSPAEAASAAREPLQRALGECSVSMFIRRGEDLHYVPVSPRAAGNSVPERIPFRAELAARWDGGTHINLDVSDTDIYGPSPVGALEQPFRSIVTVRLAGFDGRLAATSPTPEAFGARQVEYLERAAGLIGPAIDVATDEAAARAS